MIKLSYEELKRAFEENIIRKSDGTFYSINCKNGLWSVSGSVAGRLSVENEARHYFIQYLEDGEYDTPNRSINRKLSN